MISRKKAMPASALGPICQSSRPVQIMICGLRSGGITGRVSEGGLWRARSPTARLGTHTEPGIDGNHILRCEEEGQSEMHTADHEGSEEETHAAYSILEMSLTEGVAGEG